MEFYKIIKLKSLIKPTPEAKKQYLLHKKFTRRIQPIVLIIYIAILPLIETPDWCNRYWEKKPGYDRF